MFECSDNESFSRSRSIPLKYVGSSIPFHDDEAKSHERYFALVESIEIERIEAIKERWIKNACHLAHLKNFPLVPPATQEILVSEMLGYHSMGECHVCNELMQMKFNLTMSKAFEEPSAIMFC